MEIVSFAGWDRCAQLVDGDLKLIATLEVGPRILYFGPLEGPNLLCVYEHHKGQKGGEKYRSYGGHRLWISPELPHLTVHVDNDAPRQTFQNGSLTLTPSPDRNGFLRELVISSKSGGFEVTHRLTNEGDTTEKLAPWAITVMAPGGTLRVPQYKLEGEPGKLPVRPVALWPYTKMGDPRYTWGDEEIRLRQDPALGPTKFGTFVEQGFVNYDLGEWTFLKRFPADPRAQYPDFGCNFEAYARDDMLEVESLGPLVNLAPGMSVSHTEIWEVHPLARA